MNKKSFLLEIGVEELPVAYVEPALNQLADALAAWLDEQRLSHGEIKRFATPRRLALLVSDLITSQEDLEEEVSGPPMKAAYRDGQPSKAAEGFARGQGISLDDCYELETAKGPYLAARVLRKGRSSAELLAEALPAMILALRFPKTMTWGDGSLRFARPIRWIVAMLGEEALDFRLGTLSAGSESRGHRRLAPGPVNLTQADDYESALLAAKVLADPKSRKAAIHELASAAAVELGGKLVDDPELLDTVNYLVEGPAAMAGRFPDTFLELPREVISTAMKSHQRYFSVEDEAGELLPGFVVVTNGPVQAPEVVLEGNVRVLLARLEDARFYWRDDLKAGLDGLNQRLESVLWLEGFGTVAERVARIGKLSLRIADLLNLDDLDREALEWAARYAKADQASEMVKDGKEFTKLQGYMGWQYARKEGAGEKGAIALYEHFFPRSAGDRLPEGAEGSILSLADRLDAIVGFWGGGFAPTGSKDPYALRRQALAVMRLLIGKEWPLCLSDLLHLALQDYPSLDRDALVPLLLDFFHGRLEGMLEDESVAPDIFRAVLATGESRTLDLRARALALNALRGEQAFEQLVMGARRVGNILAKEGLGADSLDSYLKLEAWAAGKTGEKDFQVDLLREDAEKTLHDDLLAMAADLKGHADARRFDEAYRLLAGLGPRIDAFFDGVMVLAPEEDLRRNRLAFLNELASIFRFFAGFQEVVLEGERD